jgi:hypothetical protein
MLSEYLPELRSRAVATHVIIARPNEGGSVAHRESLFFDNARYSPRGCPCLSSFHALGRDS